jgi:hypothetical protein
MHRHTSTVPQHPSTFIFFRALFYGFRLGIQFELALKKIRFSPLCAYENRDKRNGESMTLSPKKGSGLWRVEHSKGLINSIIRKRRESKHFSELNELLERESHFFLGVFNKRNIMKKIDYRNWTKTHLPRMENVPLAKD